MFSRALCRVVALASLAVSSIIVAAQQDGTAVAVLQAARMAVLGSGQAKENAVLTGEVTAYGGVEPTTGTVKIILGRDREQRFESHIGDANDVFVVNWQGKGASGSAEDPKRLPGHAFLNPHCDLIPVCTEIRDWAASRYLASYVGQEVLDGEPVHHVRLVPVVNGNYKQTIVKTIRILSTVDLYVSANSGLLLKRIRQVPMLQAADRTATYETRYSGYRVQDGIAYPTAIRVFLDGDLFREIRIVGIAHDVVLDPATFEVAQ